MNKIRFSANKDTNYIFHMLSVAKCGYDNAYGKKYRQLYQESDLSVLKDNEKLITVRGGEHCGILYNILVSTPACALVSAKEYYMNLLTNAKNRQLPQKLHPYINPICCISEIMIKCYDMYTNSIWEREQQKILAYIPTVLPLIERINFTEKAEALVGCSSELFTAMLVTSIENGAEGIDISDNQGVFGIERTPMDSIYFIGHEFIIYLLFHVLKDEDAFKNMDTWQITEGLTEYYLKQIMGDTRFFDSQRNIVEFFEKCSHSTNMTALELYKKGLAVFR